jgi:hypothetical protein
MRFGLGFLTETASRAGTRDVATLNPNQLARKRAHDREAQRNIRQRTRGHIESLEADTRVVRRSAKWQESRSGGEKKYSARGGGRTSKGGAEWTFAVL